MDTSSLLVLLIPACAILAVVCLGLFIVVRRERRPISDEAQLPVESSPSLEEQDDSARPAAPLPYVRQRYLLTQAEREFFAVLQRAAPSGWYVFPQVRLANLMQLRKGTRNWKPHFSRIAQKCVDFVLCDTAHLSPQLVVELDDSSHNRADRQARDSFVDAALSSAGLPILHVRWQRSYDERELAAQIRRAAGLPVDLHAPAAHAPSDVSTPARRVSSVAVAAMPAAIAAATATRWACPRCNREVGGSAKFCPGCGAVLEL